jgi:hypothetical protein
MHVKSESFLQTWGLCEKCGVVNTPTHKRGAMHLHHSEIVAGIARGDSSRKLGAACGVSANRMAQIMALISGTDRKELE